MSKTALSPSSAHGAVSLGEMHHFERSKHKELLA